MFQFFLQKTVTIEAALDTVSAKTGSANVIWAGWAETVSSAMRPSSNACQIALAMAGLMPKLENVIARHSGQEETAISVCIL